MKLGVNNEVNPETTKAVLKLMAGGQSKINPPNSHPSNLVHKATTAKSNKSASTETQQAKPTAQKIDATVSDETPQHEINNPSNQPGQKRRKFCANIFYAFPQSFASGFQSVCD